MSGQKINMAMYVDGLQAMQAYLALRNEQIEIPVGRVVSIADMTLHYIFSVPCADRAEYDALVYRNVGRDRQLAVITLIVLAAMLRRADGPQARACRAVLMEDRNEDFYDGVSLYERFLEREGLAVSGLAVRGESHFSQEDFETDIMDELIALRQENMQLKNTISYMENHQYNQFNAPVYSHCTFNTHNTTNNYYPQAPEPEPEEEPSTASISSPLFMRKALKENMVEEIVQSLQRSLSGRQDKARALVETVRQWQRDGYIDPNYNARIMYDELNRILTLPFRYDGFRKYYNE
jgi:hypothetical protein